MMITWPQVLDDLIRTAAAFTHTIPFGVLFSLFIFWLIALITDHTIASILELTIREAKSFLSGKKSIKSVNALTTVLAVILVVFLFHSSISDIVIPEMRDAGSNSELIRLGLYEAVFVTFGVIAILSLMVAKHEKD